MNDSNEPPEWDEDPVELPPEIRDLPDSREPEEISSGIEMTFLEHLEDLRGTIIKSFIAFALACVFIAVFLVQFAEVLQWPFQFAISGRTIEMAGLINTSILGIFSVIFYLMMGGGFALSLPFMLYFVGQFVAPGLTKEELKMMRPACLAAFLLFMLGAVFSFFVLVPAALRASIIFNEMLGFAPLWTAASYYGLMTWMVLGVGVAFEFPLVLMILIQMNLLTVKQLTDFRRYSIVLFLCIGAVVTPTTDPVTFILLAIPMSLLYEVAIVGGKRIEAKKPPLETN